MSVTSTVDGIEIKGALTPEYQEILTPEAQQLLVELHRKFNGTRLDLLKRREDVQAEIDKGNFPDFDPDTKAIREGDWTVAELPDALLDRRTEITGPVDRKMVINALNSGAKMFMADFEDASTPSWANMMSGQINMRDANAGTIAFHDPNKGKDYKLKDDIATLLVRPRGWHLVEKHVLVDGEPISGSIFDFALYMVHNAKQTLDNGKGPYFYFPKLEHYLEARLWNDVVVFTQDHLGVPQGSVKATVLIENIFASFYCHEILYELREHSAGLNCGRWDYIFSVIKKFRNHPEFVMPNRDQVGMDVHFMRSYSLYVIQACHKRKVHAMGGMAAQIPIKNDEAKNKAAIDKVSHDKKVEAENGHDGTWVAHPGLVPVALEQFDKYMPGKNQIEKQLDVNITKDDLLKVPEGTITQQGVEKNIDVAIQYLEGWIRGIGCVPLYNLMEDAATAEISRAQVWQWVHTDGVKLEDGREVTLELYTELFQKVLADLRSQLGDKVFEGGKYQQAAELFDNMIRDKDFVDFLTLPAYELV